jgi:NADPH:quinone reductase-like Zn-dependent oxidoreductase
LEELMKAIIYTEYGPPDVLQLAEVGKPTPKDNEVLIQVRAAAVNPLDLHYRRGTPYILRIGAGLRKPKNTRLGADLAGQVVAVGTNITQFKLGDEVFGIRTGVFAEYVCKLEKTLALKPVNLTFEQAAVVPVAACTALQGLRDKGQIQRGQEVLINGAAGGVGTFAVQIAKAFGAHVTGVCSTRNVDMVRSIGADRIVDYTQEDFTKSGQHYDLLFNVAGTHSLSDCRRVLRPKGTLVVVGGPDNGRLLGPLTGSLKAAVFSRFVSQKLLPFLASVTKEDLVVLKELIEAKKVTPVIDRTYRLSEVPEAMRYLEQGHAQGKVVITLEH